MEGPQTPASSPPLFLAAGPAARHLTTRVVKRASECCRHSPHLTRRSFLVSARPRLSCKVLHCLTNETNLHRRSSKRSHCAAEADVAPLCCWPQPPRELILTVAAGAADLIWTTLGPASPLALFITRAASSPSSGNETPAAETFFHDCEKRRGGPRRRRRS